MEKKKTKFFSFQKKNGMKEKKFHKASFMISPKNKKICQEQKKHSEQWRLM